MRTCTGITVGERPPSAPALPLLLPAVKLCAWRGLARKAAAVFMLPTLDSPPTRLAAEVL
jgi:hypothetical protein